MEWLVPQNEPALVVWNHKLLQLRERSELKAGRFGGGKKMMKKLDKMKSDILKRAKALQMKAANEASSSRIMNDDTSDGEEEENTEKEKRKRKGKEIMVAEDSGESTASDESSDSDRNKNRKDGKVRFYCWKN